MLTITGADEAAGNAGPAVAMAAPKAAARPAAGAAAADGGDRLGLTMHALSDDERRSTGNRRRDDGGRGARPGSQGRYSTGRCRAGLNDTLLETPDDIPTLEANGSVIAVLIQRNNARKFVSVRAR